jgi:hypothetical protein
VPTISACSSKGIFAVAANSTNKTKQGEWFVPLISPFIKMIYVAKADLKY